MACRRNALLMLSQCDNQRALSYVASVYPQIPSFDENLKLSIIDLVLKDSKSNVAARGKYIALIVSLLETSSAAVKFEAAHALVGLTNSTLAMKG
jgi:coatomer subunit beta